MNNEMKQKKSTQELSKSFKFHLIKFLNKTKPNLNAMQLLGLLTAHNLTFQNNY